MGVDPKEVLMKSKGGSDGGPKGVPMGSPRFVATRPKKTFMSKCLMLY